ncbi:MAG: response regulator [Magnetococcales bacterium]|nr:response regulator [Magnetococcales bacterium]
MSYGTRINARLRPIILFLINEFLFAQRSTMQRFLIPFGVVAVAFEFRVLIGAPEMGLPYLTFFPAAAISAFLGGFWSGMLAALLGATIATYYYIPPFQQLVFTFHSAVVFGNVVYLVDEVIVCAGMGALRRYHLRSREQFAEMTTLFETIPEMIWVKDPDGQYLKCNAAFEQLVGRVRKQIIGLTDKELFGEPLASVMRKQDLSCMESEGVQHHEAWIHSDSLGRPILRETIKVAMRTESNRLIGVLGIGRDITERRKMEEAIANQQRFLEDEVTERTRQVVELNTSLEQLAAKAMAASQSKSSFLANMSHEIRTPLNAILGLLHLLSLTPLSEEQKEYIRKIRGAGHSLLGIINAVLDFSKIEAGRMELDAQEFRMDAMLEDLAVLMHSNLGSKPIEPVIQVAHDVPNHVRGDGLRLMQVLTNLVGNAIKFTSKGAIVLRVSCERSEADRIWLRFAVQDSGIGISEETRAQLFRPFTQADVSTTRSYGGTGLGLAISRRLVALMDGELGVESRLGIGSEFWLTVPLETPIQPEARVLIPAMRVVILVRHPLQREVLAENARLLGWTVTQFDVLEPLLSNPEKWRDWDGWIIDLELPDWQKALAHVTHWRQAKSDPVPLCVMLLPCGPLESYGQIPLFVWVDGTLTKPVTCLGLSRTFEMARRRRAEGGNVCDSAEVSVARRLAGVRILLVDDSEVNLEIAQRILQIEGAAVTSATQGAHALVLLQADPEGFDLVLMDVQMPVMDGIEAVRRIRADSRWSRLPVIALTAGAMESDRLAALDAGMNVVIAKPFDVDEMVVVASRLVGSANAEAFLPPSCHLDAQQPWPSLEGIDRANTMHRLGGDWDLFVSMASHLLTEFMGIGGRIGVWIEQGQSDRALQQLHKLQGVAGNVGAIELMRTAKDLEAGLRNGQQLDEIRATLEGVDGILMRLHAAMVPWRSDRSRVHPPKEAVTRSPSIHADLLSLLRALQHNDLDAVTLFSDLEPELRLSGAATILDEAGRALEHLEFERALFCLEPFLHERLNRDI